MLKAQSRFGAELDSLADEDKRHFNTVHSSLESLNIPCKLDPLLVKALITATGIPMHEYTGYFSGELLDESLQSYLRKVGRNPEIRVIGFREVGRSRS